MFNTMMWTGSWVRVEWHDTYFDFVMSWWYHLIPCFNTKTVNHITAVQMPCDIQRSILMIDGESIVI